MTGRELIIYILQNNLEDESVFDNGVVSCFLTVEKAAEKFNVGPETIKAWYNFGFLKGVELYGKLYILKDAEIVILERKE